jgi:plastocyanin
MYLSYMAGTAAPVGAGLATGIVLVAIFSVWNAYGPTVREHPAATAAPAVSTVAIVPGASLASAKKTFDPSVIRVVIGVNNTVRWTNNDDVLSSIVADNAIADPDFAAATQFASRLIPSNATNYLQPRKSFEFTFEQPGEIHYHSIPHPWMQGTVIVLPPLPREVAALPCEHAIISDGGYNNTLYTCLHPPNFKPASPIVFHLPAPTYRMVECNSTYGCSHRYNYKELVPPNLLSDEQKKQVLDKVMNLPEVKMNAEGGWKVDHFAVNPSADRWTADIQLFMEGIKQLSPSQGCGWYGQVDIDLETLDILHINNIPPPRSTVKCDPSDNYAISLTINGLKDTYKVGEVVDVSATQTGGSCLMPQIVIKDAASQDTVLVSKSNAVVLCPALSGEDLAKFSLTWAPASHGAPIIMNQTGRYILIAENGAASVQQKFTIEK